MSFSTDWDDRYREHTHLSVWPWSDLVSLVHRQAKPTANANRVLELGPGAGANIPFFHSLNAQYFGVEGSPYIVENLKTRFPQYKDNIVCGDFTKEIPFSGQFDLIVDRGSITHNTTESIERCLNLVHQKLKPGGRLVVVTWFSTSSDQYRLGKPTTDKYTRIEYSEGPFKGLGNVHFFDPEHIKKLLANFEIEHLEEVTYHKVLPEDASPKFSTWNLVAKKP